MYIYVLFPGSSTLLSYRYTPMATKHTLYTRAAVQAKLSVFMYALYDTAQIEHMTFICVNEDHTNYVNLIIRVISEKILMK